MRMRQVRLWNKKHDQTFLFDADSCNSIQDMIANVVQLAQKDSFFYNGGQMQVTPYPQGEENEA
jgi:uncharacterized protein YaiI (UPF0178 family)